MLEPLGVEEVEYQSVLVAFEDDTVLRGDGRDRGALAARRRRGIHVLSLINVPTNLPLDAELTPSGGAGAERRSSRRS